jgi:RND family efflux transporter MFP subunit
MTAVACLAGSPLPSPAADGAALVTVAVATIAPIYEEVPLTGSIIARRESMLSPEVDGLVDEVLVDAGHEIAAGEVLLRLDGVIARIELDRADAAEAEARARLAEAIRRREEAARLIGEKHIPTTTYEERLAEVAVNEAAVRRLEAERARYAELLERHVVTAPFDGVIAEKLVEVGQWVETGTALLRLVEVDVLRIEAPVPQQYFDRVERGTRATVRLDADPGHPFEAEVDVKIAVSDPAARTFPIRIEIANRDRLMSPGMSARITLQLVEPGRDRALLVPRDAIVRKPDGTQTVWKIELADGVATAVPVEVETGRGFRDAIEIVAGAIDAGSRVVLRGNEILEPGRPVRIVGAAEGGS